MMALAHNLGPLTLHVHLKTHRYLSFGRFGAVRSLLGQGVRRCCAAESSKICLPLEENESLDVSGANEMRNNPHDVQPAYCVVNFYHLVKIANPQEVVEEHKSWMSGRDIKGRIYFSSQGINAQYTGTWDDAIAYPKWLEEQRLFQDLRWTHKPSMQHLFPKLRLQFKPNLVQLKGGMSGLPITDKNARATSLNPPEWKEMLRGAQEVTGKKKGHPVVLDVRNGYEWDAGHFDGVERPTEDSFCQTPVGSGEGDIPEALIGQDPNTPVMMYCTGGIRCDVYSTFLRKKGFNNLFSLEGGVQNYFDEEGGQLWNGSLFVFDDRLAISPSESTGSKLPAAVKCELCKTSDGELPHKNCANIDCNKLSVTCASCRNRLQGCCCEECISAPRLLRPISDGQYQKWGQYTNGSRQSRTQHLQDTSVESSGAPSRQKRRRKISERRQAKKNAVRAAKQDRKHQAKEAIQNRKESGTQSLKQNLAALGETL